MSSWIDEAQNDECDFPAVRWQEWAHDTVDAIRNGPDDQRTTAIATLCQLADYLDEQYDGGYHGISPIPLAECRMAWDW